MLRAYPGADTSTATPSRPSGSRAHGGMIEDRNRQRSPLPSSTRRSFTRGATPPPRPHRSRPSRCGPPAACCLVYLVDLVDQARQLRIDPRLQRHGEHPPGALTNYLIQPRAQLRGRLVVSYYSRHQHSFLAGRGGPRRSRWFRGRYAAPSQRSRIRRFRLSLERRWHRS